MEYALAHPSPKPRFIWTGEAWVNIERVAGVSRTNTSLDNWEFWLDMGGDYRRIVRNERMAAVLASLGIDADPVTLKPRAAGGGR